MRAQAAFREQLSGCCLAPTTAAACAANSGSGKRERVRRRSDGANTKNHPTCISRAFLERAGTLSRVVHLLAIVLRACSFLSGARGFGRLLRYSGRRHRW
jgi:hypothetical protein